MIPNIMFEVIDNPSTRAMPYLYPHHFIIVIF